MDRVTSMRVFITTANCGSLSAAGRQLSMSPSMATKHVDALEHHLGVKLFHRSTRRLSLTEAGNNYLEACQRILADLDEADALISSQRVKASGLLRLNAPLSFGSRFIAPLLAEFSQLHPEVRIELGLTDAQVDLISDSWDLAIRIGHLADSSLHARQIGSSSMHLCAAPAYLEQRGIPRSIDDLIQHNCLSYNLSGMQSSKYWRFGKRGELRANITSNLQANNGDALLAAALGGMGIVYQPYFIVGSALRSGELIEFELDQPCVELGGIHVLYPPDRRPPAKVRVMIDFLAQAFEKAQLC